MHRPNIDEYFLNLAEIVATRSTCVRRSVGAIVVSEDAHILSTGYNGVPSKAVHCTDKPCDGAEMPSGKGLDICGSIHAEVNAIAHCLNPRLIHTMYVTVSPCMSCMKLIIATGCRRIVSRDIYDMNAYRYFADSGGFFLMQEKITDQ